MAELKCAVTNCGYNRDACCCKGDICVGGEQAKDASATCCESFTDGKKESFTSALEHPSRIISIDCEAVKCMYNDNYRCGAEHVDIKGCGAKGCRETSCATFKER